MIPHDWPRLCILLLVGASVTTARAGEPTFERDVRPILKANCIQCHGEREKLAGGLDLRLRRAIVAGGDSGPSVVPGRADDSPLIARVQAGEMPPDELKKKLTPTEIDTLRQWIAQGARAVRDEPASLPPGPYISDDERQFWSFRPVLRPTLPAIPPAVFAASAGSAAVPGHASGDLAPIDFLVGARLAGAGLGFAPLTSRRALLRRAFFDLWGLPPDPDAAARFEADDRPDAYARWIDLLLASPHYGERWGRHWLDVAGYADSEGQSDQDALRPDAYKYRDYVIQSLNADKPYDEFVREQLSGDELIAGPLENLLPQQIEKLIATGFLRMAPDGTGAGANNPASQNEVVAKSIEIVSTAILGLTVQCAQCHDHRYDPIPQADYYRLRAIFDPAYDTREWRPPVARRVSLYTDSDRQQAAAIEQEAKKILDQRDARQTEFIEQTFQRELAKLPEAIRPAIREARAKPEKDRSPAEVELLKQHPSTNVTPGSLYLFDQKAADELKKLAEEAEKVRARKPKEEFVRALAEPLDKPPPSSRLFYRGDHEQPKQEVEPGELSVLATADLRIPTDDPALRTTGRRLHYARWLTSGQHPLVARVAVNRVWLPHFGRGLVPTPGDFGFLGTRPTHPELLDWLASELVRGEWSAKRLHRILMMSRVYQQSSVGAPRGTEIDAENHLFWHMPLRRLDAETLRDATLAASGALDRRAFGPAIPVMADVVGQFVIGVENLDAGRPGAVVDMRGEEFRRSIYVQVRRSRPLNVLDTFDAPKMEPNCLVRASSTVASQSLMLMNGEFTIDQAARLARRVAREAGAEPGDQVRRAWLIALARAPTDAELSTALDFVDRQASWFAANPPPAPEAAKQGQSPAPMHDPRHEALASLCHALLGTNEFLYVD